MAVGVCGTPSTKSNERVTISTTIHEPRDSRQHMDDTDNISPIIGKILTCKMVAMPYVKNTPAVSTTSRLQNTESQRVVMSHECGVAS